MGGRRGPLTFADSLNIVRDQIVSGKLNPTDGLQKARSRLEAHRPATDTRFSGAVFEAKLYELKHMPSGEIRMVLVVPESDRAEGTKMADAYAHALRVSVQKRRES